MKSIAFVIPYFGKLPDYLTVWLASCAQNPTIDFFLFTDDKTNYKYPDNVKVIFQTLDQARELLQQQFPFPISLKYPYKLCDYKPVYGAAYKEWIGDYDFWGHCDVDIIWGNIRNFFTEEKLEKYDRVLWQGHCSIYRNCERMNTAFKTLDPKGCLDWKIVYTTDQVMAFDEYAEHNGGGLSLIMERNGIPMYKEWVFADLCVGLNRFQCSYTENRFYTTDADSYSSFFIRNKNGIYLIYRKNGEIHSKEMMYVHFQKRPIKIDCDFKCDGSDTYMVLPPGRVVFAKDDLSMKEKERILTKNKNRFLISEMYNGLEIVQFSKKAIRYINKHVSQGKDKR